MYQSLHCHTRVSDGQLSHPQVLDLAARHRISVVAFTDHDALPDTQTVKLLQEKKHHPTRWIIGCELTCSYPPELGGGPGNSFHLTGLFLDPFDQTLIERNQKTQQARIERMQRIVKNLQDPGFKITADDCLQVSGGESLGRPHIVQALKEQPPNHQIIDRLLVKMKQAASKNPAVSKKYQEMLRRGPDQYPYYLFLSSDAFIPDIYVPYLYTTDMNTAVKLIRNAGGVSFFAHWTFYKRQLTSKYLEKFFREDRIDGAEILYGMGTDHKDFPNMASDMQLVQRLTQEYHRLQSGGGDLHTRRHFAEFAASPFAPHTSSLAQNLLADPRVHPHWSSFA